jgi:hypothetical protein
MPRSSRPSTYFDAGKKEMTIRVDFMRGARFGLANKSLTWSVIISPTEFANPSDMTTHSFFERGYF